MPEITKEETIEEKLKYIGIELEHIPNFLKEYAPLDYRPLKSYVEQGYKVYRYVPIRNIQILLTPETRLNTIQEKYSKAAPVYAYLKPTSEEDILRHTTFLKMLKNVSIQEIEQVEREQKILQHNYPFKVKYHNNYLWQIYYSDTTNQYFMLATTEDLDYTMLFYLLKKQIECYQKNKEEYIYVPISQEEYSLKYLKKSEITDMEKYIWLFTKEWPLIYEVYDQTEQMSIQIVGEMICYESIKSTYKIVLHTKEDASKFFKLLKAMFILQTEIPQEYHFKPKIDVNGGLEFVYKNHRITYDTLGEFLNKEYQKAQKQIISNQEEEEQVEVMLEELHRQEQKQTIQYLQKEKQIATYLECRRTFFGKVKYFFKSRKLKKETQEIKEEIIHQKQEKAELEEKEQEQFEFVQKEYYTIEDAIKIREYLTNIETKVKNKILDKKALENKVQNLELKIKNATLYIDEIDRHEKSIFEFWKFANKDENLLLQEGITISQEEENHLQKVFDYEEDREEIGRQFDKEERKQFSKVQTDAIYLASTELIDVFNHLEDEEKIKQSLERLKEEAEQERILFGTEHFDIFGGISEDGTKIKTLGNQKHRENEKDKFKLLEIHKNTQIQDYQKAIQEYGDKLEQAFYKIQSPIGISIYKVATKEEEFKQIDMYDIRPEEVLKLPDTVEQAYLYRIKIQPNDPIIALTNSIYFDNYNKTLPLGMDVSTKVLLNTKMLSIKLKEKDEFRVNEEVNEIEVKTKKINVYEYETEVKVDD